MISDCPHLLVDCFENSVASPATWSFFARREPFWVTLRVLLGQIMHILSYNVRHTCITSCTLPRATMWYEYVI
jgi:hypothetical protein